MEDTAEELAAMQLTQEDNIYRSEEEREFFETYRQALFEYLDGAEKGKGAVQQWFTHFEANSLPYALPDGFDRAKLTQSLKKLEADVAKQVEDSGPVKAGPSDKPIR